MTLMGWHAIKSINQSQYSVVYIKMISHLSIISYLFE